MAILKAHGLTDFGWAPKRRKEIGGNEWQSEEKSSVVV